MYGSHDMSPRAGSFPREVPGNTAGSRLVLRWGQRFSGSLLATAVLAVGVLAGSSAPLVGSGGTLPGTRGIPAGIDGSDSFEVVGVDASRAAAVARGAADLRCRISSELLGVAEPDAWTPRCVIHVHLSEASFAAAVGGSPASARGATSIEFVGDDVGMRRIDVMGEISGEVIPDALAHELVHVILADRFVVGPPPRWADEGLAMLFDTDDKQRGHEEDFRDAAIRGLAWSGLDMFEIDLDPADIARERVFYGESLALVRWFLAQGSAGTFLEFLDDCEEVGLASALGRHYGISSLVEFDSRWQSVLTASR
jgi:hypothetical protein